MSWEAETRPLPRGETGSEPVLGFGLGLEVLLQPKGGEVSTRRAPAQAVGAEMLRALLCPSALPILLCCGWGKGQNCSEKGNQAGEGYGTQILQGEAEGAGVV